MPKSKRYINIEDIIVPAQKLEAGESCYEFLPMKIISLADSTCHREAAHSDMPQLIHVDYSKVRFVSIFVKGYDGGGLCSNISREDFDKLKRSCMVSDGNNMLGKSVTLVSKDNYFIGFLLQYVDTSKKR